MSIAALIEADAVWTGSKAQKDALRAKEAGQ